MDLTPRGIRTHLGLNRPIYQRTSAYGHFGRAPDNEGGFSWERTDLADALRAGGLTAGRGRRSHGRAEAARPSRGATSTAGGTARR